MTQIEFIDALLRGGVFAMALLSAARLFRLRHGFSLPNLAALFATGVACYVVVTARAAATLHPLLLQLLIFMATMNSVFFWWFATALFDDEFQWHFVRVLPGIVMACLYVARLLDAGWASSNGDDHFQQLLIASMMVHALALSIFHYRTDLVEGRRRFRLWFASLVSITGLIIAAVEFYLDGGVVPESLALFQASALFVLSFVFCSWILARHDLLQAPNKVATDSSGDSDQLANAFSQRLKALMEDGVYREEGMSIAVLADRLGLAEYRLRQLINRHLGYKNFNAYLNEYRIRDAKKILADPEESRRQITLIALDLGYGSIATFNRAFKQATGVSPSVFRNAALAAESVRNSK